MPLDTFQTNHKSEAHYFGFDQILTKGSIASWMDKNGAEFGHEPTAVEVDENFKPGAINMLAILLKRGDKVAILSNGTSHHIKYFLKLAFRNEPKYAEKIEICCSETDENECSGMKAKTILDLAKNKWPSIDNHFFYDHRGEFIQEVSDLAHNEPYFKDKLLKVTLVLPTPSEVRHIQLALNMKPTIVASRLTNLMNDFLSRKNEFFLPVPPLPPNTHWKINNLLRPTFSLSLPPSCQSQQIIHSYALLDQLQAEKRLLFSYYENEKNGPAFYINHDEIDMDYFCEPLTLLKDPRCPWMVTINPQEKPVRQFLAFTQAPAYSHEQIDLAVFLRFY